MEQTGTKLIEYLIIDDDRQEVMFSFLADGAANAKESRAEFGYSGYDLFVKVNE